MTAGFTSVGMDVVLLGPMPTPAVALLTREMRADVGVMISASHNPFEDNGIKLFGPDGFKLSDDAERAIEAMIEQDLPLADAVDVGRARRIEDARGRYIHAVKGSLPHNVRLDGLRIVVDCANGAAYHVAPSALWELGAARARRLEDAGAAHPARPARGRLRRLGCGDSPGGRRGRDRRHRVYLRGKGAPW
jgi:phosphoglucosamine mutase